MTTRRKPMKLFVWENVLCDWSCGMITVIAKDLDSAIAMGDPWYVRRDMQANMPEITEILTHSEPKMWTVSGGS